MRLGEILIKKGLITNDRLQEALALQAQRGGKIGSILVSLNYVDKDEVGKNEREYEEGKK